MSSPEMVPSWYCLNVLPLRKAMKNLAIVVQTLLFGLCVYALSSIDLRSTASPENHAPLNVIEGTVFDPNRRPVPDLWIELQNEFNLTYGRIRTGPSGRFTFSGVKSGRYEIKVYTTGTDF